MKATILAGAAALLMAGCTMTNGADAQLKAPVRVAAAIPKAESAPKSVPAGLPMMRWSARKGSDAWTKATLAALQAEGVALSRSVPTDVAQYCPGYASQSPENRRAFWAGLLSALSKHESSHNPGAKGGGGRYLGLMQISPGTARSYGCGSALLNGGTNMQCAVKIAAKQVTRDNMIAGGRRGLARDWGPMTKSSKRAEIAAWTRKQSYCQS